MNEQGDDLVRYFKIGHEPQGFAVAAAARAAGADVTLIAGPVAQPTPTGAASQVTGSVLRALPKVRKAARDAGVNFIGVKDARSKFQGRESPTSRR